MPTTLAPDTSGKRASKDRDRSLGSNATSVVASAEDQVPDFRVRGEDVRMNGVITS
jgi:hypothetical protein